MTRVTVDILVYTFLVLANQYNVLDVPRLGLQVLALSQHGLSIFVRAAFVRVDQFAAIFRLIMSDTCHTDVLPIRVSCA